MDSLATESCHLADRLATKLFFKVDNADAAGPNVIMQGAWQSLSVQDASSGLSGESAKEDEKDEFEEEGSKEDGEKAPAGRRKVPKSQ